MYHQVTADREQAKRALKRRNRNPNLQRRRQSLTRYMKTAMTLPMTNWVLKKPDAGINPLQQIIRIIPRKGAEVQGITALCISDHCPMRPRSFCHDREM